MSDDKPDDASSVPEEKRDDDERGASRSEDERPLYNAYAALWAMLGDKRQGE